MNDLFKDITGKIIGCAMKTHSNLGPGFQEVIYQRALAVEMKLEELVFVREFEMPIYYRNEIIGTRRVDFFVDDSVTVEIKAIKDLNDTDLAQAKNYLEAHMLPVGLLLNFGTSSLQYKRVFNNKNIDLGIFKRIKQKHLKNSK